MRTILFFTGLMILSLVNSNPVFAADTVANSFLILDKEMVDKRVDQLGSYLTMKHSPLLPHVQLLISTADTYKLPWNLIPSISGVESNFCKVIPLLSYNCWGWNNGNHVFANYESAIETVAKTLRLKYYDRGLNTVEKINSIYATSNTWASKVNFFMDRMENFQAEPLDPSDELSLTL